MTEEELVAIEARAKAATPGPWVAEPHTGEYALKAGKVYLGGMMIGNSECRYNAAFIASAREDVPALIAALREAWQERDAALATLEDEKAAHLETLGLWEKDEAERDAR